MTSDELSRHVDDLAREFRERLRHARKLLGDLSHATTPDRAMYNIVCDIDFLFADLEELSRELCAETVNKRAVWENSPSGRVYIKGIPDADAADPHSSDYCPICGESDCSFPGYCNFCNI